MVMKQQIYNRMRLFCAYDNVQASMCSLTRHFAAPIYKGQDFRPLVSLDTSAWTLKTCICFVGVDSLGPCQQFFILGFS